MTCQIEQPGQEFPTGLLSVLSRFVVDYFFFASADFEVVDGC
jgi:hypothetical protein